MANSYASLSLKLGEPQRLEACLAMYDLKAEVSGEYAVVPVEADEALLEDLAKTFSDCLDSLAFAVINNEDERLAFWVYDRGNQVEYFDSNPAYMCCAVCSVVPAEHADAEALAARFGVPGKAKTLKHWMARKRGLGFLRESERHAAIAQILGLPRISAVKPVAV